MAVTTGTGEKRSGAKEAGIGGRELEKDCIHSPESRLHKATCLTLTLFHSHAPNPVFQPQISRIALKVVESAPINNALVYALAETYGLRNRKELWKVRFEIRSSEEWNDSDIVTGLRSVYETPSTIDRGLRNIMLDICYRYKNQLIPDLGFHELLTNAVSSEGRVSISQRIKDWFPAHSAPTMETANTPQVRRCERFRSMAILLKNVGPARQELEGRILPDVDASRRYSRSSKISNGLPGYATPSAACKVTVGTSISLKLTQGSQRCHEQHGKSHLHLLISAPPISSLAELSWEDVGKVLSE
ncbi:MAG: hypothetical protein Q9181_002157 [Wetmoreana brouardii]